MGERVQTPQHEIKVEGRLDRQRRSGRTAEEKTQIQTGAVASP